VVCCQSHWCAAGVQLLLHHDVLCCQCDTCTWCTAVHARCSSVRRCRVPDTDTGCRNARYVCLQGPWRLIWVAPWDATAQATPVAAPVLGMQQVGWSFLFLSKCAKARLCQTGMQQVGWSYLFLSKLCKGKSLAASDCRCCGSCWAEGCGGRWQPAGRVAPVGGWCCTAAVTALQQ
jgi:hypothetical protein